MRRATNWHTLHSRPIGFLSTLSLRRATQFFQSQHQWPFISIHALLAESDVKLQSKTVTPSEFLSTLSLRRATLKNVPGQELYYIFLSTLSLRRATQRADSLRGYAAISIHALLAESDGKTLTWDVAGSLFLSTLSLRRATIRRSFLSVFAFDFYPRSPCGERRGCPYLTIDKSHFYPRSPCGERQQYSRRRKAHTNFYPRSPCGERRTGGVDANAWWEFLSTLSLRRATSGAWYQYRHGAFLSTLSLRRATVACCIIRNGPDISIHALLAESDLLLKGLFALWIISIHALLAESDWKAHCAAQLPVYFYPRSPCGERRNCNLVPEHPSNFYPRSPCGERHL